ncbi:MAG: outer membrane beta-barrel protein [Candidatus Competibacteraceae bacterium]|nr:outer membrane beta-barrel protein [Candidatus Competibacteraceae bacterium]
MKKFVISSLILFMPLAWASAQNEPNNGDKTTPPPVELKKKKPKPKKQDLIIMNLNWNGMLNQPDSMQVSPYSRGFDIALVWDIPFGRSPFSFAAGLGFSSENIFMNSLVRDSAGGDYLYFRDIKTLINADNPTTERDWNRYKISLAIIELPVEFRYRMKPHKRNTFKFAAGFKVGYVISNWEKYVGPDYRLGGDLNKEVKIKEYELDGISRLRYSAFFRIGYSRFHLTGKYDIAPFFEPGKGINTGSIVTLGFSFTPF